MPRKPGIPRPTIFTNPQGKQYVRVRYPLAPGKYETQYYGSAADPESQAKAKQAIAAWLSKSIDVKPRLGLTVNGVIVAYLKHAATYYKPRPGGTGQSKQLARVKVALGFLQRVAGDLRAEEFGPNAMRDVREAMVITGKCRSYVNYLVSCILRAFRWAVSYQLVSVEVHIRLGTLEHLKKGRSLAKEGTGRTEAIPIEDIRAAIPYLPEAVAGMILLQLLTGMRPGEVLTVRAGDIVQDGPVVDVDGRSVQLWQYKPQAFKGDHLENTAVQEVVLLGEKCIAVLKPLMARAAGPESYLFPATRFRRSLSDMAVEVLGGPVRQDPGNRPYSIDGYCRACKRACKAAKVAAWTPKRIRHTRATELRRLFKDADAAQAVLRHRHISTTERYAHLLLDRAAEVMARVG